MNWGVEPPTPRQFPHWLQRRVANLLRTRWPCHQQVRNKLAISPTTRKLRGNVCNGFWACVSTVYNLSIWKLMEWQKVGNLNRTILILLLGLLLFFIYILIFCRLFNYLIQKLLRHLTTIVRLIFGVMFYSCIHIAYAKDPDSVW